MSAISSSSSRSDSVSSSYEMPTPAPDEEVNIPQEFKNDQKKCCTPRTYIFVSSPLAFLFAGTSFPFAFFNAYSQPPIESCCDTFCVGPQQPSINCTEYYFNNVNNTFQAPTTPPEFEWISIALAAVGLSLAVFSIVTTIRNQKKSLGCNRGQWTCTIISGISTLSFIVATITFTVLAHTENFNTFGVCGYGGPQYYPSCLF